MLHEVIEKIQADFSKMKGLNDTLGLLPSLRLDIQKACAKIKGLIDSGALAEVDPKLNVALTSLLNILSATEKGMDDDAVVGLFGNPGKH